MTTRGHYLRLHECIDNRRALAHGLSHGAARDFLMTVPAVLCASAFMQWRPLLEPSTPKFRKLPLQAVEQI